MLIEVCKVKPGETIYFHGKPCTVLEHFEDGTLVVYDIGIKAYFGNTNNFAESELREYLNSIFIFRLLTNEFCDFVIGKKIDYDEIVARKIDLTDALGNNNYGECECKIAPLTSEEILKYNNILPTSDDFAFTASPYNSSKEKNVLCWAMNGLAVFEADKIRNVLPAFIIKKSCRVEVKQTALMLTTSNVPKELLKTLQYECEILLDLLKESN